MAYRTEAAVLPHLGRVEKVLVDDRWVGFLSLQKAPDQYPGDRIWFAHYGGVGGHGVESREDGLRRILHYAEEHPDFVMQ